jgi:hypothetical protein
MAVTGAWAQSSLNVVEFEVPKAWETDNNPVTAADLPGFKAVTLDEAKAWTGAPAEGYAILFYSFDGNKINLVNYANGGVISYGPADFTKKTVFDNKSNGKFYYTATEPTEWELKPDDTGKKWILAKMPASNIELQVEYFAESNLFLSKEALADKDKIAVKAGELGVQFDKDGKSANTVTEGTPMTVKFNGTKKVIGMKVAKKAPTLLSIQIDGHVTATIYYFEGETWEQAIQNHPTENSAWKIDNGNISANGANLFAGGNYEKVNPNSTIDPNTNYYLLWT